MLMRLTLLVMTRVRSTAFAGFVSFFAPMLTAYGVCLSLAWAAPALATGALNLRSDAPPLAPLAPLASSVASASTNVVQTAQVRAELMAYAPQGIGPGKPLWLGLQIQHQPEWHTYWKNAGDSGLATELQWSLPQGMQASAIQWPTPHKIRVGDLANFGYEDTVLLPVAVQIDTTFRPTLPTDTVRLTANWLVCRQECIPQAGEFVLQLDPRSLTVHGAKLNAALKAVPNRSPAKAAAVITGVGSPAKLLLTITGLPRPWTGKPLGVMPEQTAIFDTAALPSPLKTPHESPQQWTSSSAGPAVWNTELSFSPLRTQAPETLDFVLVQGTQSLQVHAKVESTWPTLNASPFNPVAINATSVKPIAIEPSESSQSFAAFLTAFLGALLGGLLLNLMPCVFPVLAIKVLGVAAQAGQQKNTIRLQGMAYTAGVVVSMLLLASVFLLLRAGGQQIGWGFQLQSPAVVAGLAVLFVIISWSLAGWLQLNTWLPGRWAGMKLSHPVADAAWSGVLAVVIATPCTAPFMGASLGLALTMPAWQSLGIFTALGLGLSLPFLAISWIPAWGRWLPKPGLWMVQLQQALAFPMAATAIWLVWVLGHMNGNTASAALLVFMLSLGFVLWALQQKGFGGKVWLVLALAAGLAITLTMGPLITASNPSSGGGLGAPTNNSASTGSMPWRNWSAQAVETELAAGRPVFVDYTAAWCITCQLNEQTTLRSADVLQAFADRGVVLMRADWTHQDAAISESLRQLGRSGVPVYVLHRPGKAAIVLSELLGREALLTALNTP